MFKRHVTHLSRQTVARVCALIICAATMCAGQEAAPPGEPRYSALPNFHQVNARLYRGAQPKAGGLAQLAALGIKTIINLRGADEDTRAEELAAHALGLNYYSLPLAGLSRPKQAQVEQVLALINAAENFPVFVHCKHGADRTGTIIACYRIAVDGWTQEAARAEAKRYGMHWTQRGMRDFIHDFARDHAPPVPPVQPLPHG